MDTTSLQTEGEDYKNVCGQKTRNNGIFHVFCSLGTKTQTQSLPHKSPSNSL